MSAATVDIPQSPRFERAGNGDFYYWDHQRLVRVTHVVDMFTGGHLPIWYAQMTADECADIIARKQAGELSEELADFMIMDVPSRKTAAIRYRDEKGAIGSLMHHATHQKLLGISNPGTDWVEYLADMAVKLGKADPERDEPGREPYAVTLAKKARHYVASLFEWWDRAEMEVSGIGLEAMIVSSTHTYAGSADVFGTKAQTKWLRKELGKDFPLAWNDYTEIDLVGDYKSSNQLNLAKVRMQLSAYRHADFIGFTAIEGLEGSTHPIPSTHGAFALHVKPVDGCKMVGWADDAEDWEVFLSLRHAYGYLYDQPMQNPRRRSAAPTTKEKGAKTCPF